MQMAHGENNRTLTLTLILTPTLTLTLNLTLNDYFRHLHCAICIVPNTDSHYIFAEVSGYVAVCDKKLLSSVE